MSNALLAQWVEHQTFNLRVKGSSPLQGVGIETIFYYFKTIFGCNYLCVLLQVDPEIRIRFTSPHPKDFPNEVSLSQTPPDTCFELTDSIPFSLQLLQVMRDHQNVCKHVHLPVQSGSSRILKLMRRGCAYVT